MTAALVLSGGPGHPASASTPALVDLLGAETEVFDDVDTGLSALDPARHELLVVNALAFQMLDDRYDDTARSDHAFRLGDDGRRATEGWLAAGRPLLALHTAVISFDDWPRWPAIIGGGWDWSRSSHPPIGPVEVHTHQLDVPDFTVVDERYTDLAMGDDVEVLATVDGIPVAWRRIEGDARVACCTLGHDERSLADPGHRALLRSMTGWLLEVPCPN